MSEHHSQSEVMWALVLAFVLTFLYGIRAHLVEWLAPTVAHVEDK